MDLYLRRFGSEMPIIKDLSGYFYSKMFGGKEKMPIFVSQSEITRMWRNW